MKKLTPRQFFITLAQVVIIYLLTTLLAYALDMKHVHDENLLTLYLLGIIIIVIETKSFITTVIASVVFLLTHNYMFLKPYFEWSLKSKNFWLSAAIFFVVALVVNTLVVRLQYQIKRAKKNEELHKRLFEANQGLLTIHGKERIISYSDEAITKLAGAQVSFFFDIDKNDENEAKRWCFKNSAKCGHGEAEFPEAGCKYIPIRSKKKTIGVVAIDCTQKELDKEAEECVIALLSQISIAIERTELEAEARKEEKFHERERTKATVFKSISHDIYPRVQNIITVTKNINENMNLLEESEIHEKLSLIEADADYVAQNVDNLLGITMK